MDPARTLHHVGFVVADIAVSAAGFAKSLGLAWDSVIHRDPLQCAKVTFLSAQPGQPQLELVEPDGERSPVRRFLEHGGGLHHICYEVEGLEEEMAAMKALGAAVASRPKPAVAFGGRRVAWMLTAERLLVELLERRHSTSENASG